MNFAALPDDILLSIARLVYADASRALSLGHTPSVSRLESCFYSALHPRRPGSHPLIPLSLTCRRLRSLCATVIFRLAIVSGNPRMLAPANLLVNAQTLHCYRSPSIEDTECLLQNAQNVRELFCEMGFEWQRSLFALPGLETINLCDVFVPLEDANRGLILRQPLRSFRMVFSTRWARSDTPVEEERNAERAFVENVLSQTHDSLEQIVLPGESTSLSFLVTSHWPSLQELAICGEYPPDLQDVPLPRVLCMLPHLRVLTLALASRRDQAPLVVWPEDWVEMSSGQSSGAAPLRRLRRFTLSFPQQEDLIFEKLPYCLTELSLRDSPRYYERHHGMWTRTGSRHALPGQLLSCAGALRIFRGLHEEAAENLARLELVIQEAKDAPELEMDLYAQIASSCPRLLALELHRYRDAGPREHTNIPVTELVTALSAFSSLRELRVNLDFPRLTDRTEIFEDFAATAQAIEATATAFAGALTRLERVAVLSKDAFRIYRWRTWDAIKIDGRLMQLLEVERDRLESMDLRWL